MDIDVVICIFLITGFAKNGEIGTITPSSAKKILITLPELDYIPAVLKFIQQLSLALQTNNSLVRKPAVESTNFRHQC